MVQYFKNTAQRLIRDSERKINQHQTQNNRGTPKRVPFKMKNLFKKILMGNIYLSLVIQVQGAHFIRLSAEGVTL